MLKKFLDLGEQPLANSYLKKSQLKKKEKKIKLEIIFNEKNYLVSIKKKVSKFLMFNADYPYRSSQSSTMIKSFRDLSDWVVGQDAWMQPQMVGTAGKQEIQGRHGAVFWAGPVEIFYDRMSTP